MSANNNNKNNTKQTQIINIEDTLDNINKMKNTNTEVLSNL